MRLIIDSLLEKEHVKYEYLGVTNVMDPNLVSLNFIAKKGAVRGELNVRGLIDMPLDLKAQYDSRSPLNDYPEIQIQISNDLTALSKKINRVL